MRRRSLLALLLAAPIAGCAHPSAVLDFDEATNDDVANAVSTTVDPGDEAYRVLSTAREDGSSTRHGRYELIDSDDTVRLEDAFYDVTETALDERGVTVYTAVIDFDPDDTAPALGSIDVEELPATDRQRLDRILTEGPTIEDGETLGVEYGTASEVANDSVLVPDQRYDVLVRDGERYEISVETASRTETTYRYELREVAPDVASFADDVRGEYRFTLTDLSADERDVVEEAITDGYYENDDAFESVLERIRAHDGLDVAEFYGTWLLAYDGVDYLVYAEW